MAIAFDLIPDTNRVPFVFVEFDSSRAQSGPSVQKYKILVLGQKTDGIQPSLTPVQVSSSSQALKLFGSGSMLHGMLDTLFQNNTSTEVYALALNEPSSGVEASAYCQFDGNPTKPTEVTLKIAGRKVSFLIQPEDSIDTMIDHAQKAINSMKILPVTASASSLTGNDHKTSILLLKAKNKGELGNEIKLDVLPKDELSLKVTIHSMSGEPTSNLTGGLGKPNLKEALEKVKDTQFHIIACALNDKDLLTELSDELTRRFSPQNQIEGYAFCTKKGLKAETETLGAGLNCKHLTIMGAAQSATPSWEWSAALAGVCAFYGAQDPARPFQTLPLYGVIPPPDESRFNKDERNDLLNNGISTFTVDSSGQVRIERLITTYKTNEAGTPDLSYLSTNTLLTLSYIRFDFVSYFLRKYPRHKLASDHARVAPGQPIMTPKLAKAECIALFRNWEELGLVEGIEQFKSELIVERNAKDPSRLDFYLPPRLVSQLIVLGAKVGFLL